VVFGDGSRGAKLAAAPWVTPPHWLAAPDTLSAPTLLAQYRGWTFVEFTVAMLNWTNMRAVEFLREAERRMELFNVGRPDRSRASPFYDDVGVAARDPATLLSKEDSVGLEQTKQQSKREVWCAKEDPAGGKDMYAVWRQGTPLDTSRVQLGVSDSPSNPSNALCFHPKCDFPSQTHQPCVHVVTAAEQVSGCFAGFLCVVQSQLPPTTAFNTLTPVASAIRNTANHPVAPVGGAEACFVGA
jgi:hypothetical protein